MTALRGTQIGGHPAEVLGTPSRSPEEPAVRLVTIAGSVTVVCGMKFDVQRPRHGGTVYDWLKWTPAAMVRPGDQLFRPAGSGQDQWISVDEVAHLRTSGPLHLIETDEETVLMNGFLVQTQPPPGG
ncbi:MAG: hypothetical protein ACRD2W_16475 [Acidimicrobiales bacterium]